MSIPSLSLGQIIRKRRLELGWTQEQLAERISVDDEYVRQSEISRIESGRIGLPRRERLERIATALDVPLGELLARSGWTGADLHLAHRPHTAARDAEPDSERRQPNPATSETVIHGDGYIAPERSRASIHAHTESSRSTTGSVRDRREEFTDAMTRLRTEKERLLRNHKTTQNLQEQLDRRLADQESGRSG